MKHMNSISLLCCSLLCSTAIAANNDTSITNTSGHKIAASEEIVSVSTLGVTENEVEIKAGKYVPLYLIKNNFDNSLDDYLDNLKPKSTVSVDDFAIDVYPVTNADFLQFVKAKPNWQRSNVKTLFAEKSYLHHWLGDQKISADDADRPVTNVSWFAAKQYCESHGKRLPMMDEWEYVALADQTTADARDKEDYNQYILDWYSSPTKAYPPVGSTFKNYWGVYDMHGSVWEWTLDFNSVLISGESRKDVDQDSSLFCGTAAIGADDLMNYAAFIRYAFRGSVKANYAMNNLGFRCVRPKK